MDNKIKLNALARGLTVCLLVTAPFTSLQAASFDCTKARTYQEKAICFNPDLSQQDENLYAIYKKAREAQANSPEFKKTAKALYKERNRCKTEECLRDWMIKASDTYRKLAGEDSSVTLEQALQNPDISPSDANKPAKAPQTVETIKLPPSPGGLTVLGFLKLGQTTPEEAVAWLKKNHKYTPKDPEVQDLYDKRLEPKFGKLTVMGLPSLIGDLADKSYLAFVGGRLYQVAHDIKESKYKHIRSNLIEKYNRMDCLQYDEHDLAAKGKAWKKAMEYKDRVVRKTHAWTAESQQLFDSLYEIERLKNSVCFEEKVVDFPIEIIRQGKIIQLQYQDDRTKSMMDKYLRDLENKEKEAKFLKEQKKNKATQNLL